MTLRLPPLVSLNRVLEAQQTRSPETFEELAQLRQPLRSRAVEPPRAVSSLAHEASPLEHLQVLGHARPADIELLGNSPGSQLVIAYKFEDLPAPRLSQCLQRFLHASK